MSQLLAYQSINYEKAINKAVNNPDMDVKEKHVRAVIMCTFSAKGAELFWRVALGFPYTNNKAVAWKLCYVLHKILIEGHSLCCYHSQNHKTDLERIGKAWNQSIIQMYTKLLTAKLEFHFHHPNFPGHLDVTLSELQFIVKNDMNDYFQLSVDILEYLNQVIQFQETVFQSQLHTISVKNASKCARAPLVLSIKEASQLYDLCVRILFILHSSLPTELLQGHRIRFGDQFKRLKAVYSNAKTIHMLTVPSLPEKAPNFFIEANLPLEGLESSRRSCIDLVDNTAVNWSRNMLTQQIAVPKSNRIVEQNLIDLSVEQLIDLSNAPPFHQVNHLRSRSINSTRNMLTQQSAVPKNNRVVEQNLINPSVEQLIDVSDSLSYQIDHLGSNMATPTLDDPFDISFLEFRQQSTKQPSLSPVIHQKYIENMIAQQSKAERNSLRPRPLNTSAHTPPSPISHRAQLELRSTEQNVYNGSLNMQTTNTFPQRSNSTEGNFFNQFEYNGDCRPSAPPLSNTVTDHQIHSEAILERDNQIQYLQYELEKLRHQNYRMESDHFNKFQEKITSLEKSLFAKENEVLEENKIKMLINQVPSSPQYRSERPSSSLSSVFENNNSKSMKSDNFKIYQEKWEKSLFAKENEVVQENKVKMLINQVPSSPQYRSERSSSSLSSVFENNNSESMESDNFKKFQEKLEKSLFTKENEVVQENKIKMLINQVPSSPQYRSERSSSSLSSVFENNNSESMESDNFKKFQEKWEKSLFAKENEVVQENKIKMLINQVPSSPQYRSERSSSSLSSVFENNNSASMESDNFKKFQEKLEKSLFTKENEVVTENKIKMLINQVPSSPQYRSECSSSVLENNNSKNFSENIEERQSITRNLKAQDEQVGFSCQTTSFGSDWNDEDEIDEVQNGIENFKMLINQVPSSSQYRSECSSSSLFENNNSKSIESRKSFVKSFFGKENESINQVPSSPQYRSECSSSVLENNNSKNFSENFEEKQSITGNLKAQDEQVGYAFQTASSDSDWDDEDEIELQIGIENLELENKIRDIEQQIDLHMKNKDLEIWNDNRELFNIKTEILKMSLENLIKEKQAGVAEPEEKSKKGNLVNRKFKKVTSFFKDKKIKLKG